LLAAALLVTHLTARIGIGFAVGCLAAGFAFTWTLGALLDLRNAGMGGIGVAILALMVFGVLGIGGGVGMAFLLEERVDPGAIAGAFGGLFLGSPLLLLTHSAFVEEVTWVGSSTKGMPGSIAVFGMSLLLSLGIGASAGALGRTNPRASLSFGFASLLICGCTAVISFPLVKRHMTPIATLISQQDWVGLRAKCQKPRAWQDSGSLYPRIMAAKALLVARQPIGDDQLRTVATQDLAGQILLPEAALWEQGYQAIRGDFGGDDGIALGVQHVAYQRESAISGQRRLVLALTERSQRGVGDRAFRVKLWQMAIEGLNVAQGTAGRSPALADVESAIRAGGRAGREAGEAAARIQTPP
jgi:hypothetical protein